MNELDKFVEEELIPGYTSGKRRRDNKEYKRLYVKVRREKMNGNKDRIREILKSMKKLPSVDTHDKNFRRLKYIRYADDFRAKRFHTN